MNVGGVDISKSPRHGIRLDPKSWANQSETSSIYSEGRPDFQTMPDYHDEEEGRITKKRPKKQNVFNKEENIPWIVTGSIAGLVLLFVLVACLITAIHRIPEGHVGVYFKNGALLESVTDPGIHWSQPFVTQVEQIKVRPETKFLDPMICTTQDGVRNVFRDVQVISSIDKTQVLPLVRSFGTKMKEILIYERITEAVQVFCANNSIDEVYNTRFLDIIIFVNKTLQTNLDRFAPKGAILIWNVFLPKPEVPPAIAANYREVKIEWTKQLVAEQKQKTETILKETQKIKAVLDAEREKEVERIDISKEIQREEGKKNVSAINNAIFTAKMLNEADTMTYVQESEASSNKLLFTDEYIKLQIAKSLMNNTKMFFSGSESLVGSLIGQVFGTNTQSDQ
ncbi:hypothetical protein TCAL_08349 [Tigriopus californicus]|uniref:Band 7 domain-containing protein n=1 Tax=Tigriopus californicus TaxID=6832 RepID=A0A553PHB8_TIGCA|nr:erlin-like [Tigriopus californicus]TRY77064.1 hypothetical protein TCAL_08349 [Tigriopus californicus]